MGSEGIKAIATILDNSSNISKEIRNEVYKLLGLNTQSEQLSEYVNECLERFNFNSEEVLFLQQLRMKINEEINKLDLQRKNNEQINYESFESALIEKIKNVVKPNVELDDDIKNLANQIVNRFPQINISIDQLYTHFMSKKEQITDMINQHNKNIVDALTKLTPQLVRELSELANKEQVNMGNTNTSMGSNQPIQSQQQIQEVINRDDDLLIGNFVKRCSEKLNEVNIMFKNGGNSKSEIAKGFRELKRFIENLNDKDFAQNILDRYAKLNESVQETIYDEIIFRNVPMLKEIYEKHKELLNNGKVNTKTEPKIGKQEKTYDERKQELINHFINHTIWVFAKEIKQSYPYDLSQADISEYKNSLRGQLNIPAYPITDEEFDEIINTINNRLKEFVSQLILDDEQKRNQINDLGASNSSFYLDGFEEKKSPKKM